MMNHGEYKWVVHGFYFENENDYNLALKDEERYLYIMKQVENEEDKGILVEVYNKLNESEKFKTVVGMSYLKGLYEYIIAEGIATERDMLPIEGFTIKKLHSASSYSYAQLYRMRNQMDEMVGKKVSRYKNAIHNMKVAIFVLVILVATLFYLGINKNNASNYVSAKEAVEDEYAAWESELIEREKKIKEKEEEIDRLEDEKDVNVEGKTQ